MCIRQTSSKYNLNYFMKKTKLLQKYLFYGINLDGFKINLHIFQCGFFKRKTRDDLEKMKQKDTGNDTSKDTGKDNASFTDSEGGIIDKEEPPAKA